MMSKMTQTLNDTNNLTFVRFDDVGVKNSSTIPQEKNKYVILSGTKLANGAFGVVFPIYVYPNINGKYLFT